MLNPCVIVGSLRQGSYNRGLAEACQQIAGGQVLDLAALPLFSQDYEREGQEPDCAPARELRGAVRDSKATVLITPEYDGYPSGAMLNAINWCSREPQRPFLDKPVMVLSASPSMRGGRRAQHHLREMMEKIGARVLEPMLCVSTREGFDSEGRLLDDRVRGEIACQLEALSALAER